MKKQTVETQRMLAERCINFCVEGGVAGKRGCTLDTRLSSGRAFDVEITPCKPFLNEYCEVLERLTPRPVEQSDESEPEPDREPVNEALLDVQFDLVRACPNRCQIKDASGRFYEVHGCQLSSPPPPCKVHHGRTCPALIALYPEECRAAVDDAQGD
jgi:hypothetical protein